YPDVSDKQINGKIKEIVHESGRGAPLAYIELSNNEGYYTVAPEGSYINQEIQIGKDAIIQVGNILPLNKIPEGTLVCNIEIKPGDGGRIARSGGSFATVIAHNPNKTVVKLPSRRNIAIQSESRATIGVISGGGRLEKPYLKAGEAWHAAKSANRVYPTAHGVKMYAGTHPHGGGRHRRPGKSTTVGRRLPPGAKVGLIAARTSGRGGKRTRGAEG
ncbi:50S ribosomal protein L2, partial [Candidatus Bathyarchaeota archaeon]|nr:50S ribosomal protein L2 [Candidatus Bathyarchaeota archaeon]